MSDEINQLRQEVAVLKESQNTMLANFAKHKAESDSAFERLRTEMVMQGWRNLMATVIVVSFGIALLGNFSNKDSNSTITYQSFPSAYQPPAASVLPDPN